LSFSHIVVICSFFESPAAKSKNCGKKEFIAESLGDRWVLNLETETTLSSLERDSISVMQGIFPVLLTNSIKNRAFNFSKVKGTIFFTGSIRMSSSRAHDSIPGGARRSYIATQVFNDYFYSYNNGEWGSNPGTFENCPAGRILRETGKKLYPGANPNVDEYYVGVYDAVSLLNGFIDPNTALFAPFNDNKPVWVGDTTDHINNQYLNLPPLTSPDAGPPVLTNGNIVALGNGGANYIGVTNTLEGIASYAYLAYQYNQIGSTPGSTGESFEPYVGVVSQTEVSSFTAYLGTNPVDISGNIPAEAYLRLTASNNNVESTLYAPNVYLSSGNGSNLPAVIQTTGVLSLPNSSGSVELISSLASVSNNLVNGDSLIFLTRKNKISGSFGHLSYTVSNSTVTINSSTVDERSNINYLIINNPV